jgi:small subunit ribosomal protein S4e
VSSVRHHSAVGSSFGRLVVVTPHTEEIGALFDGCMFPLCTQVLTLFLVQYSIRFPDPAVKVNDTVKIDLATGKITDFVKFEIGALAMVTGGRNMGRVGVITHRERHDGGFNIVHIKDAIDNSFATRESNVFVIGQDKPWISLPKGKGVKLTIAEERDRRRANAIAGH